MVIKKFTAASMTEALAKVREELGSDAIILQTRTNRRGGVFDFMKHAQFEVTAAYDDGSGAPPPPERPQTGVRAGETGTYAPARQTTMPASAALAAPLAQPNPPAPVPAPPVHPQEEVSVRDLTDRIDLERVLDDIRDLKRSVKVLADTAVTGDMGGLPRHMADFLHMLRETGFDEQIAKRVVRQMLNDLTGQEINDPAIILDRAVDLIVSGLGDICPVVFAGAKPRIVAFVGPTGTGKTTTIAKLATEFSLTHKRNVSVLTIDTKRIDAVGQLKSYCRIINIPLHIAYQPDELPAIMPKLMTSDVVLVDTPGSGPMDRHQMLEMVEFLQRLVPQEVHLTMSVTTSLGEMHRIATNFGILKPNRILFTKLDETEQYGPLFSFASATKKPLSYVTFGQNVPGDFAIADPRKLLQDSLKKKRQPGVVC